MSDYEKLYTDIVEKNTDCGIDRKYIELGNIPGPVVPEWVMRETIYEIYIRAFTEEGTFRAAKVRLIEIKKLGIQVIWLMPVHPIGLKGRKGSLGCPYAIRDYFAVNPEYGTEQDFKEFVGEAHKIGMRVVMDLVVNHVSPDHAEPQYMKRDASGSTLRKVADWSDVADLDYNLPQTREYILAVMQHWVREFKIDGYRCDVAGMVPQDFWEWAFPKLTNDNPDLFFLAEWESPRYQQKAFHSYYDWSLFNILSDVCNATDKVGDLRAWLNLKTRMYPQNSLPLRFLENHDKPRAGVSFSPDQVAALLVFLFTIDGIPLIYNGQESGNTASPSLFEKETVEWPESKPVQYNLIKLLIELRRKNPAMSSKKYEFITLEDTDDLLVYKKDRDVLVIINFSDDVQTFNYENNKFNSLLLNTEENVKMNGVGVNVSPWQAMVWENVGD